MRHCFRHFLFRLSLLILAPWLSELGSADAQSHSEVFIGAGLSAAFIRTAFPGVDYSPCVLPGMQAYVLVPVKGPVAFKTGIAYEQWGWNAASSDIDSAQTKSESIVTIKLHALTIPLQAAVDVMQRGKLRITALGGMSYAFLTAADARWTLNDYRRGQLYHTTHEDYHPTIALIPDGSRIKPAYDYATYYRFSTSMRGDVAVGYNNRYFLLLSGTYSLTELTGGDLIARPLRIATASASLVCRLY